MRHGACLKPTRSRQEESPVSPSKDGSELAWGADDSCESDPSPSRFVRETAMGQVLNFHPRHNWRRVSNLVLIFRKQKVA